MLTIRPLTRLLIQADGCPWGASAGRMVLHPEADGSEFRPLYTPDERRRRDASPWTMVQGILAPIQFLVFLASVVLVIHYLATDEGYTITTASIVLKTLLLYTIMITGSIWEKDVFGRYLFAPAFYWEDVVSMLVLALHTAYLVGLLSGAMDATRLMWLALAAYASYAVNATQFLLKLRAARRESEAWSVGGSAVGSST